MIWFIKAIIENQHVTFSLPSEIGNDKTLNFMFVFLQSHGNSSIGSEASGVSPPQSTDGYDQDEQNLDQVSVIDF